jgi:hypothetical protein
MPRLRRTLVALLAVSTVLFAVGAIAEHSSRDTHTEPAVAHADDSADEATAAERTGDQADESPGHVAAEREATDSGAKPASAENTVLGVNVESRPLLIVGVLAGLGLATLAAGRIGRRRDFLIAVIAITLPWTALDVREVGHQLDESRTAVAVIAIVVAGLHIAAAAISGRLAQRPASVA